jgi:hypothetical protein
MARSLGIRVACSYEMTDELGTGIVENRVHEHVPSE